MMIFLAVMAGVGLALAVAALRFRDRDTARRLVLECELETAREHLAQEQRAREETFEKLQSERTRADGFRQVAQQCILRAEQRQSVYR